MLLSSASPSVQLEPPSGEELFWVVRVAVNAAQECSLSLSAAWQLCNVTIANGSVPLSLNLPEATNGTLTISQAL